MKQKHIIIVAIGIVLFLILGVFGYFLFQNWREDVKKREDEIVKLKNDYDLFSTEAKNFNSLKEEYDKEMNLIYYNTLSEKKETIENILGEYKISKNSLETLGTSLEKGCESFASRKDLQSICHSYKTSLETANNVYKEDVTKYQELITKYNEWVDTHPDYSKIEEYKE